MPSDTSTNKFFDSALKVMSGLVFPLLIWGVRLEISSAVQSEQIAEMQEDLERLSKISVAVQGNSISLVQLEGKIDNVNSKIDEVKKLLRSRVSERAVSDE